MVFKVPIQSNSCENSPYRWIYVGMAGDEEGAMLKGLVTLRDNPNNNYR